jgi:hypothetical protein
LAARDGDGLHHEFGHVETLEQLLIELGGFLREDKWLVRSAILVEIADVRTRVVAIIAT